MRLLLAKKSIKNKRLNVKMKLKRHPLVINLFKNFPNEPIRLSQTFKKNHQSKLDNWLTTSMETFNYPLFKISLMLGANPNIDAKILKGYNLVTRCARSGEALFLETLIEFGGDVHSNCPLGGYLPLHIAATKGMASTIEVLIKHKANIHAVYYLDDIQPKEGLPFGWTALICACMQNKTDAAKKLLDLGANPFDTNEKGVSALEIAKKLQNTKLVNAILEKQKHYQK